MPSKPKWNSLQKNIQKLGILPEKSQEYDYRKDPEYIHRRNHLRQRLAMANEELMREKELLAQHAPTGTEISKSSLEMIEQVLDSGSRTSETALKRKAATFEIGQEMLDDSRRKLHNKRVSFKNSVTVVSFYEEKSSLADIPEQAENAGPDASNLVEPHIADLDEDKHSRIEAFVEGVRRNSQDLVIPVEPLPDDLVVSTEEVLSDADWNSDLSPTAPAAPPIPPRELKPNWPMPTQPLTSQVSTPSSLDVLRAQLLEEANKIQLSIPKRNSSLGIPTMIASMGDPIIIPSRTVSLTMKSTLVPAK